MRDSLPLRYDLERVGRLVDGSALVVGLAAQSSLRVLAASNALPKGMTTVELAGLEATRRALTTLTPTLVLSDLDLFDGSGLELASDLAHVAGGASNVVPVTFVSVHGPRFSPLVERRPISLCDSRARGGPVHLSRGLAPGAASPPLTLVDYVLLAAIGTRPVSLQITHDGKPAGRVLVRSNQAWSAEDGKGVGCDAFLRLASLADASIVCVGLGEAPLPNRVFESIEVVLMRLFGCFVDDPFDAPTRRQPRPSFPSAGDMDVTITEATPPSKDAPRVRTLVGVHPVRPEAVFEELREKAIDLVLKKKYAEAYEAFCEAEKIRPEDPSVVANLQRLRALGHGN